MAQGAAGLIPGVGPLIAQGIGALAGGGGAAGGAAGGGLGQAVAQGIGAAAQGIGQAFAGGGQRPAQAPQGPFQGTTVAAVAQPVGMGSRGPVVTLEAPQWTQAQLDAATARNAQLRQEFSQGTPGALPVAVGPVMGLAGAAAQGMPSLAASAGAAELAEQARRLAIPAAAEMAAGALRAVDARAGAELGDLHAQQVLRRAITSESQRVRSALQIARSLLDLR